jgi:hypothetical protein
MTSAALTWANRPPPSSRAINPVTKRVNACANTENIRSPANETPKTPSPMRSRNGVTGG